MFGTEAFRFLWASCFCCLGVFAAASLWLGLRGLCYEPVLGSRCLGVSLWAGILPGSWCVGVSGFRLGTFCVCDPALGLTGSRFSNCLRASEFSARCLVRVCLVIAKFDLRTASLQLSLFSLGDISYIPVRILGCRDDVCRLSGFAMAEQRVFLLTCA